MVDGMATKKYTVTLPEELAEEIRSEVGPGSFSAYVTQAIERQRERDRLGELVADLEAEYGPVTEDELAAAEAERRDNERWFAERRRGEREAATNGGNASSRSDTQSTAA
jgi:Arc/MetJ-type ribon-helix-helix transcriptional regulator